MNRSLKIFAVLATFVMFLVMIAGSLVTNTGSAQGCGSDWPLCNGKFIPEYTFETLIEYSHRVVTGLAGVIVIVFSIWAWLRNRGNKEILILALFGIFFILVESVLGAAAVIWPQTPPVLALHFGFSLLAFTGVFLLALVILQKERRADIIRTPVSKSLRNYIFGVTIYTYGVIYLGAYVRHSGASLACLEWPFCSKDQLLPELTGPAAVQFVHRIAAAILFFLILGLLIHVVRTYKNIRPDIFAASIVSMILITVQILSGGYVVLSRLHIYATTLHSAGITLLFGTLCYLCLQSLKKPE